MNIIDTGKKKRNWRSEKRHTEYMDHIANGGLGAGCVLCEAETITEFEYWKLIDNKFPYDAVSDIHHMIIPKRHTDGNNLSVEENAELNTLKQSVLNDNYTFILEALPSEKSIPQHFHFHLIKAKVIQ